MVSSSYFSFLLSFFLIVSSNLTLSLTISCLTSRLLFTLSFLSIYSFNLSPLCALLPSPFFTLYTCKSHPAFVSADRAEFQHGYILSMKCWLQYHFLGSRGHATYVQKLNMDIVSCTVGVCRVAIRHTPPHFTCLTHAFINVFGTFLLCLLHFVSTAFIFPLVFFFFFCFLLSAVPPLCLSLSFPVLLLLSKLCLSVSDIVTVYEYRHRQSKDKRQHLPQKKPWWLLDLGCN